MSGSYAIIDEPRPGRMAHLSVDPMWPLFAFMVGGPFFSWSWSLINGFAIGSPTLRREIITVLTGVVLRIGGEVALGTGMIEQGYLGYARLALTTVELAVCYLVYVPQARAFEMYEYYGGKVASGIWGLALALMVGSSYHKFIMQMVFGGAQ